MKKYLLLSLAATAMMTACSSDEIIDQVQTPEQQVIGFTSFVNKSTRATDLTTGNLQNFGVYGFMESVGGTVFENEEVTKKSGSWTYKNTQYWTPGKTYYFSAIAPYNAHWKFTNVGNVTSAKIDFDNSAAQGETDLLFSPVKVKCSESLSGKPEAVSFTFDHLLSRVAFKFVNAMTNKHIILKIRNVKITNAFATGAYTYSKSGEETVTSGWATTQGANEYELSFKGKTDGTTVATTEAPGTTDHKYMIPLPDRSYKLDFTIDMYNGTVLAHSYEHKGVNLGETTFVKGNSYLFTATLNANNIPVDPDHPTLYPIEFKVDHVADWGGWGSNTDITLPEQPQKK